MLNWVKALPAYYRDDGGAGGGGEEAGGGELRLGASDAASADVKEACSCPPGGVNAKPM